MPDTPNNQVIVRAPRRAQNDIQRLIEGLDLRRPQVYLEALIVSVSDDDAFSLAIESQGDLGDFQFQNAFGELTTPGAAFPDARVITPSLSGFTAAVIESSLVPFVINALKTETDARVLSTPQLLVNDNEEASIVSLEEQPTTSTQTGQTSDITSFAGFQEAGTRLVVTPTISEAGFLRLEYEVELSSFTGPGTGGLPSPRTTNTITGLSTIPSDATIVLGGITVTSTTKGISKIPIIGDIPIIGELLFSDSTEETSDSTLYVFITPRILSDEYFRDLKLLTKGPQADIDAEFGLPEMVPTSIELIRPARPSLVPAVDLIEEDEAALSRAGG